MDKTQLNRAWLEVDLGAVCRNADRLSAAAGLPLIAMVKGDAYGLGAVAVGRALGALQSVWALGVATVSEGQLLRDNRIASRVLCCAPVLANELPAMYASQITPSLSRVEDIEQWAALGDAPWHLAIDTGLNRAGARWDELSALRDVIARFPPEGVFTHFLATTVGENSRAIQEQRFLQALIDCDMQRAAPHVLCHVDNSLGVAARSMGVAFAQANATTSSATAANAPTPNATAANAITANATATAATANSPNRTFPFAQLARPGMSLYGWPESGVVSLEPVLGMFARVVDMRTVQAGDTVSYGGTWTAAGTRRLATLSIGHADGYRRSFSNRGKVVINGTRCSVVGIVTMDMTIVDVTNANCTLGDVATLLGGSGEHRLDISEVGSFGDISPYELLVGFKLRLPHVYLGEYPGRA